MKVAEDSAMDARSLATEGKTQAVMIAERLAEDVRECSAALTRKVRLHTHCHFYSSCCTPAAGLFLLSSFFHSKHVCPQFSCD